MDVSENSGTPKSSILIGFSITNHPFWGTPSFGNTHIFFAVHLPMFCGEKKHALFCMFWSILLHVCLGQMFCVWQRECHSCDKPVSVLKN